MRKEAISVGRFCVIVFLAAGTVLAGLAGAASAADDTSIRVVKVPPTDRSNDYYRGNRPPLTPSPLIKLPIGAIRPEGWLRTQLELMAEGMVGRLPEISQWCNFDESAWTKPDGEGKWPWEEMPYWLKGFGDLGYVLEDPRITAEATRWIKAIMATQRADGTFGPKINFVNNDLWPHMCTVYALRSYYEATGDAEVIAVLTKYFKYVASIPPEKLYTWDKAYGAGWWQWVRAADHLDSMHWLYNITGEKWLLDLARVNHERTANWTKGVANWHGVNIAECWRGPAQFYQQSHDPMHLQAAIRNYDTVVAKYGQVPGGMYGADENCREGFYGPRQGAETCAIVEMMHSHEILLKITGDVLWADRCEDVAFNSMPPTCTPDYKALHYLVAPNQIQLCRQNKAPMIENRGDMFSYSPYEQYRCCQHNVAFGWPYYAEHAWFATPGNGLAVALYAPGTVKAKVGDGVEVTIQQVTQYPFGDTVEFTLDTPKDVRFALALRIPHWCDDARVRVNGKRVHFDAQPGAWAVVDRTWKKGDVLRLRLPMQIRTRLWEKNRNAVSVDRGPLTYSLRIEEEWKEYDNGRAWAAYEVFPKSPWNYGLVLDAQDPARSFEFSKRPGPLPAQPFTLEAAPVSMKARARRIPQWEQEPNGLIGEIQDSPVRSEEPIEEITLIPMGCARLRVSAFPWIGDGPDAKAWQKLPPRGAETASWCNPRDTTAALTDNILPKNSADTSIPRFTWWDHCGSKEWVELALPEPRMVRSVAVYWFDDTGTGACRVPQSWYVETRTESGQWEVAKAHGPYTVEKDRFNEVTFEPVLINKIRIVVQLQPGYSGGILECRIGD
ncbi:MAG TPA: glycoside hydrolase family 127 protein [Phycisphaerae bacterium]|nr:glycoside hydrolase family 127 protein [Phycisphaerae bacterium]